jgi:CheY-like chemotaxis protein
MDSPTVLCIDDLPQALELRKAALESHGYCVKIASSGYAALKMLEETPVTAVLLEYKQEGMDAEAVACHIKQRFPDLPIILLSAYAEIPERILWLVDEYVMKSELPERLVPIIQRAISSHKLPPRSDKECLQREDAKQCPQPVLRRHGELIDILLPHDLQGLHRGCDLLGGNHRLHRNGGPVGRARDFSLLPSQLVERA